MTYPGRSFTVVNRASPATRCSVPRSPRMRLRMIRSRKGGGGDTGQGVTAGLADRGAGDHHPCRPIPSLDQRLLAHMIEAVEPGGHRSLSPKLRLAWMPRPPLACASWALRARNYMIADRLSGEQLQAGQFVITERKQAGRVNNSESSLMPHQVRHSGSIDSRLCRDDRGSRCQAADGDRGRPDGRGNTVAPEVKEDARPGRISCVRNAETPSGSGGVAWAPPVSRP